MRRILVLFITIFQVVPLAASEKSEILTLREVLERADSQYPLVLSALLEVEAAGQKVISREGAFDFKLKGKADARTQGYYNGRIAELELVKPLPFAGLSLSGGYRMSDGEFPLYEGKSVTGEDGEFSVGVNVSLLRGFLIDKDRYDVRDARLKQKLKESKATMVRLKVQRKAMDTYAKWRASKQAVKVYGKLLSIAEKRTAGLEKRVAKGDLARIYLAENNQYIVKRRSQLQLAQQELVEATRALSLFYRDEEGGPVIPGENVEPEQLEVILLDLEGESELVKALERSPEMEMIRREIERQDLAEKMGNNDLLPRLDVAFESSKDQGPAQKNLEGTEHRVGVFMEIPLERRKGQGKVFEARTRKSILLNEKRLIRDQIAADITVIQNKLNTLKEIIKNTSQEVELADQLENAEQRRFGQGASDFFVVNLREQASADARIKNIKAGLEYSITWSEYLSLTYQLVE